MNINEYIVSGIVELYAMDALPPAEKKEFERLMILYPEIGKELNRTKAVLEKYVSSHSLNPRPQVRQEVIGKIESEKNDKPKGKSSNGDYSLTYKYMIAASLAALVVSTFASWFFYSRWNEAEERYTELLNEKIELSQNYNLLKLSYDESVSNLVIIRDESSDVFVLHSKDTLRHYQARVYWNKYSRHTYIDVISLPKPEEGMQFQLWAISGREAADVGVLLMDEDNIQRMKDVVKANSWLITMEPRGGSVTPSMDQMVLRY